MFQKLVYLGTAYFFESNLAFFFFYTFICKFRFNIYIVYIIGELLWENHRSVCKYLNFLSDDIKNIESTFGIIEGVLGASVINYGTAIVTLVI